MEERKCQCSIENKYDYYVFRENCPKHGKERCILLGEVARKLEMQTQYVMYYITGLGNYPKLGDGLRIYEDKYNYHSTLIHKDDVDEFVRRLRVARGE